MKKQVIIAITILFSAIYANAQALFDKYENQDGVTSIIVTKKMFDLMSNVKMDASDKEAQKYLALIKKLDNLKVYMTLSPKTTADMRINVEKFSVQNNLTEIMRTQQDGKNVKIYAKSNQDNSQIKEMLLFIEHDNSKTEKTVLMHLTGDFNLNEIAILTNRLHIPDAGVLKNK
jgi:hypothetical protein